MTSQSLKIWLLAAVAALAGCAASPATPCHALGTSACGGQASNVARDVAGWHNAHNASCPYVRPVSAKIIRDDGDAVVEHWTIEGCDGKRFTYRAYLLPSRGAMTVMVSDVRPDDQPDAP